MDALIRDARSALRLIWKEKLFSFTVIVTLAACVGANASIFSVVYRVLLAPLPYEGADRLVTIFNSYPNAGAGRGSNGTVDYFQRREHIPAFEQVAQYQNYGHTLGEAGESERAETLRATPLLFSLLGVSPILGRTFLEEETREGTHQRVILSYGYWQDRYAGDRNVIGQALRVDGEAYEVVGVLPSTFACRMAASRGSTCRSRTRPTRRTSRTGTATATRCWRGCGRGRPSRRRGRRTTR